MRIYVAAPFEQSHHARQAATRLRNAGFTITSHWHEAQTEGLCPRSPREEAVTDLHDVGCAQVLLLLNLASSEGKCVEMGYALHAGLDILLVGERSNIFHFHPRVRVVPSLDAAIEALSPPGVPSHETIGYHHATLDTDHCRMCDDGDAGSPSLGSALLLE